MNSIEVKDLSQSRREFSAGDNSCLFRIEVEGVNAKEAAQVARNLAWQIKAKTGQRYMEENHTEANR